MKKDVTMVVAMLLFAAIATASNSEILQPVAVGLSAMIAVSLVATKRKRFN